MMAQGVTILIFNTGSRLSASATPRQQERACSDPSVCYGIGATIRRRGAEVHNCSDLPGCRFEGIDSCVFSIPSVCLFYPAFAYCDGPWLEELVGPYGGRAWM